MRTLLILMVSAIALVVAGLVALPWLTPQDFARERLAAAIERRGHFRLETAQNIRMQAFPKPGFEADNLVLRLAGASKDAPGVSVGHVFLTVEPLSLFSRRTRVSSVEADQARVLLGGRYKEKHGADNRLMLDRIDLAIERTEAGPDAPAKLTGVVKSVWLGEDVHVAATLGKAHPTKQLNIEMAILLFQATSKSIRLKIDGAIFQSKHKEFKGGVRLNISLPDKFEILRPMYLEGRLAIGPYGVRLDGLLDAQKVIGRFNVFGNARGFKASMQDLSLFGGHGWGSVELKSPFSGGGLRADFNVSDVDALSFSQSVSNFDWVSGKLSLGLKVNSPESDVKHILDHLKGNGRVTVDNGAIEGLDLPGIVADIRDGEIRGWRRKQGRRTVFDRFDTTFRINDSVATISELQLKGPSIAATGKGTANLAAQKLDLRLKAQVDARDNSTARNNGDAAPDGNDSAEASDTATAETASLTVPLRIKGDWNRPKVQPDVSEALKDRKSLKKSIKLFGKSIEKITGGQVKSRDLGKLIDGFLGKKEKKKKKREGEGASAPAPSY